MNKIKSIARRASVAVAAAAASASAFAIDTTAVATEVASAKTDIATIGGLIIGVVVAVAAVAWVRRVIR